MPNRQCIQSWKFQCEADSAKLNSFSTRYYGQGVGQLAQMRNPCGRGRLFNATVLGIFYDNAVGCLLFYFIEDITEHFSHLLKQIGPDSRWFMLETLIIFKLRLNKSPDTQPD